MRDADVFKAIVAALAASQQFATVTRWRMQNIPSVTQGTPAATVIPRGWVVQDLSDTPNYLRTVTYQVVIALDDSEARGDDRLEDLARVVSDTCTNTDFGLGCLPQMSFMGKGEWPQKGTFPRFTVILSGSFAYFPDT